MKLNSMTFPWPFTEFPWLSFDKICTTKSMIANYHGLHTPLTAVLTTIFYVLQTLPFCCLSKIPWLFHENLTFILFYDFSMTFPWQPIFSRFSRIFHDRGTLIKDIGVKFTIKPSSCVAFQTSLHGKVLIKMQLINNENDIIVKGCYIYVVCAVQSCTYHPLPIHITFLITPYYINLHATQQKPGK